MFAGICFKGIGVVEESENVDAILMNVPFKDVGFFRKCSHFTLKLMRDADIIFAQKEQKKDKHNRHSNIGVLDEMP